MIRAGYQPQRPKKRNGVKWGIIIFLLIIFASIVGWIVYKKNLDENITGIYEWADSESAYLLDPPIMAVRIEGPQLKIVGSYPDETGFLVYGSYPFIYKVDMYPIKGTSPSHYITYFPMQKNEEFYMYISKNGNDYYAYKKTDELPSDN